MVRCRNLVCSLLVLCLHPTCIPPASHLLPACIPQLVGTLFMLLPALPHKPCHLCGSCPGCAFLSSPVTPKPVLPQPHIPGEPSVTAGSLA